MAGNGDQLVVTQVNVHQVEKVSEGSGVDAGDLVVTNIDPLEVEKPQTGKHVCCQLTEQIVRHIEHLATNIYIVRYLCRSHSNTLHSYLAGLPQTSTLSWTGTAAHSNHQHH